jgi:transposase-like protein
MSGTIFQDSHLPLMLWFRAMWLIVSHKFGANAMGLHQTLGMSYTTAWNLLHKLRKAMVRPGRELLSGMVEVDETYIGGLAEGSPGRSGEKKALVVIAIELRGKSLGRVRMRVIASATSENLIGFVKDNVEVGSAVITDGWSAYSRLMEQGYGHNVMSVRPGQEVLSNVHLIVSLLKRWLLGTYQGAVDKKRLEYYLDEYTFRFNRRKSRGRGKLFLRLIEQAVVTEPVTRKQIRRLE